MEKESVAVAYENTIRLSVSPPKNYNTNSDQSFRWIYHAGLANVSNVLLMPCYGHRRELHRIQSYFELVSTMKKVTSE